jgi:hypothetical protein
VDFARRVLRIAGIEHTPKLGRLIYGVVRKRARIHGDLKDYPPMIKRSRATWSLPSDDK